MSHSIVDLLECVRPRALHDRCSDWGSVRRHRAYILISSFTNYSSSLVVGRTVQVVASRENRLGLNLDDLQECLAILASAAGLVLHELPNIIVDGMVVLDDGTLGCG